MSQALVLVTEHGFHGMIPPKPHLGCRSLISPLVFPAAGPPALSQEQLFPQRQELVFVGQLLHVPNTPRSSILFQTGTGCAQRQRSRMNVLHLSRMLISIWSWDGKLISVK